MGYIESVLKEIYQTDKEYIKDCKQCFLNENIETQEYIQEASTDELLDELKTHNWVALCDGWAKDYCKAIKYELMLRLDFKEVL